MVFRDRVSAIQEREGRIMANAHLTSAYSVVHLLWEQRLLSLLKNEGNFDQVPTGRSFLL